MASEITPRCGWVSNDKIYQDYHDNEWGRPELDSQRLFQKLCLDGQQAGLSWLTILKKQHHYENAFHHFDPVKIVSMSEKDVADCLTNPGIVRNKLKVQSIIKNARGFLAIEKTQSFADFIWQFTEGRTIVNQWTDVSQVPAFTRESQAMAKALKKAGFSFVGETICYAFMQAVGMVNDHETRCHCYEAVCQLAKR